MSEENKSLEPIVNLLKRRGFLFPSAEIYGGAAGLYDLGPLGTALSNNIKNRFWWRFVQLRNDMLGLDASILTPAPVLKASGHVDSFADPLIECGNCHIRLRADHFLDEKNPEVFELRWKDAAIYYRKIGEKRASEEAKVASENIDQGLLCPNCGERQFSEPRMFNMMFKTNLGPVENEGTTVYLRPETAQGIFINFKNILQTYPRKLPVGIVQIGKAFRNEITTGNSLFRVREFEQMEIEYFVKPGEDEAAFEQWLSAMEQFLTEDLGIASKNLRRYEGLPEEIAHYSKRTVDFEYNYPFGGWNELWGLANRTDYDLTEHQNASGKDLTYFDEETREKYIPYVIEPSLGVGRALLATVINTYREYPNGRDGKSGELETVLHLPVHLAPIRVAVLPLMKKDGLAEKAQEIATMLRPSCVVSYDEAGAIGRRYRRHDEIGTPECITVDYTTLQDDTVTIRDRDSMEQYRLKISELTEHFRS